MHCNLCSEDSGMHQSILGSFTDNISLEINKVVFIVYKDSFNVLSFAGRLRKDFWGSVLVWCFFPCCFQLELVWTRKNYELNLEIL